MESFRVDFGSLVTISTFREMRWETHIIQIVMLLIHLCGMMQLSVPQLYRLSIILLAQPAQIFYFLFDLILSSLTIEEGVDLLEFGIIACPRQVTTHHLHSLKTFLLFHPLLALSVVPQLSFAIGSVAFPIVFHALFGAHNVCVGLAD